MLEKLYERSSRTIRTKGVDELVRVYEDLERTLKSLSKGSTAAGYPINLRKLVEQLSRSKKRLERKIGNQLLLKRQNIRRKIKRIARSL